MRGRRTRLLLAARAGDVQKCAKGLAALPREEKAFKRVFDEYSDAVDYKTKFMDQNAFLVYYTRGFDGPDAATKGYEQLKAVAEKDATFTPAITDDVPDFKKKQRQFAAMLEHRKQAARMQIDARKKEVKPFAFRTDARMGQDGGNRPSIPSRNTLNEVKLDQRRDELFLPEQRWPYLSTRAEVKPRKAPDFAGLHAALPHQETTNSAELRRAAVEEELWRRQRPRRAHRGRRV